MKSPSINALKDLGLNEKDAAALRWAIENASNKPRDVDQVLAIADRLMDGHGVETLAPEGAYVDRYWRDAIALYVNMGDTYEATLIYDTEHSEWLVMSWGDFLEDWEVDSSED